MHALDTQKDFRARMMAVFLLAYFVIATFARLDQVHNLWWVSHATLLLAALGFWFNNKQMLTGALVLVAIPHMLWTLDYVLHLTIGGFGIVDYIQYATPFAYVTTLHHLWLAPLLTYWVLSRRMVAQNGWIVATGYYLVIALGAYFTTNPEYNVNCVFSICNGLPFTLDMTGVPYWLLVLTTVLTGTYLLNKLLTLIQRKLSS